MLYDVNAYLKRNHHVLRESKPYFKLKSSRLILGTRSRRDHARFLREYKDEVIEDLKILRTFYKVETTSSHLPVLITVKFKLLKPLLGRGDETIYIIDNPFPKDHLLKIPLLKASALKGLLRHSAIILEKEGKIKKAIVDRLFGPPRESDNLFKGRIKPCPVFFKSLTQEVITPLAEKRVPKEGVAPISFEAVPQGSENELFLLYFPHDKICEEETRLCKEVINDLQALRTIIYRTIEVQGLGAKRSSGFGQGQVISFYVTPEKWAKRLESLQRLKRRKWG